MADHEYCGDKHPGDDAELTCTRPVGHKGEHTMVMIVRWGTPWRWGTP